MEHKTRCMICGKETKNHGIPFTLCDDCSRVVTKYLEIKNKYEKALMKTKGIESIQFNTENEDIDYELNKISEHITQIKIRLVFVENALLNIEKEVKGKRKEGE